MAKIKDEWLRFAIRESNGNKVNVESLKKVERIEWDEYRAEAQLPWGMVGSLEGIEYCHNLKYLSLIGSSVGDISPLANLEHLETIYLSQNPVEDIRPLANKTRLEKLWLDDVTWLKDISGLKNLPALKDLHLRGVSITDCGAIAHFHALEILRLDNTKITDISSLAYLPNLKKLTIRRTSLDFSEGSTNLNVLLILLKKGVEIEVEHAEKYRKMAMGISIEVDVERYAFYKREANEYFADCWKEYQIGGKIESYGKHTRPLDLILTPHFLKRFPVKNLIAVLEKLLSEGVDINARKWYVAPASFTYLRKNKNVSLEVVRFLIGQGAYVNTFYRGESLYDLAVQYDWEDVADFLLENGAKKDLIAQLQQIELSLSEVQAHFPEIEDFRMGAVDDDGDFIIWGLVDLPYPYKQYRCYFINDKEFRLHRSGTPAKPTFDEGWEQADKTIQTEEAEQKADATEIPSNQLSSAPTPTVAPPIVPPVVEVPYDENPTDTRLMDLRKQFGKVVRYHYGRTNSRGEFKLYLEIWANQFFCYECSYWGPLGIEIKVHTTSRIQKADFEKLFDNKSD